VPARTGPSGGAEPIGIRVGSSALTGRPGMRVRQLVAEVAQRVGVFPVLGCAEGRPAGGGEVGVPEAGTGQLGPEPVHFGQQSGDVIGGGAERLGRLLVFSGAVPGRDGRDVDAESRAYGPVSGSRTGAAGERRNGIVRGVGQGGSPLAKGRGVVLDVVGQRGSFRRERVVSGR
jgi:hypothetical protein